MMAKLAHVVIQKKRGGQILGFWLSFFSGDGFGDVVDELLAVPPVVHQ